MTCARWLLQGLKNRTWINDDFCTLLKKWVVTNDNNNFISTTHIWMYQVCFYSKMQSEHFDNQSLLFIKGCSMECHVTDDWMKWFVVQFWFKNRFEKVFKTKETISTASNSQYMIGWYQLLSLLSKRCISVLLGF